MAYIPRLSETGLRTDYRYSSNQNPFVRSGYPMPNCTTYCYGRWWELLGTEPTMLPLGDAGTWYWSAPSSIQKGSTPQLGAIAVWYDPYGYYAGHVAVVEQIYDSGHILTSNSGYKGTFFYTEDNYLSNGWLGASVSHRPYRFAGFLYLPGSTPGGTWEWIKRNDVLDQAESDNNAVITAAYLSSKGWTRNSIAGALGNFMRESLINPGAWQNYYIDPSNGYGLAQWTPSTKWTNYAAQIGVQIDDGYAQLDFIDLDPLNEWISTTTYPETLADFKISNQTPEYLASVFAFNYERAGVVAEGERRYWARYYYDLIENIPTLPPVWGGGETIGLKVWQMIRYRY